MTASSSPGEVGGKPLHGWSCACGDTGPGDHAETTGPAGPQWTWTDEALGAALDGLAGRWPGAEQEMCDANDVVLAALAPHVARQVADLTAEVERLTRALRDKVEAVKALCDAAETPPGYVSPEWRQAVLEGDASPVLLVRDIRRALDTTPPTEGDLR